MSTSDDSPNLPTIEYELPLIDFAIPTAKTCPFYNGNGFLETQEWDYHAELVRWFTEDCLPCENTGLTWQWEAIDTQDESCLWYLVLRSDNDE